MNYKMNNTNDKDLATAIAYNKRVHPHLANDEYFQHPDKSYTLRAHLEGIIYGRADEAKAQQEVLADQIMTDASISNDLRDQIAQLTKERDLLKEALEFYARSSNWFAGKIQTPDHDCNPLNTPGGKRAREVLAACGSNKEGEK